jgi:hypothetical protein
MLYFFIFILALYAVALHFMMRKKLFTRIQTLERDLQSISSVVSQMIETQMKTHHKYTANLENLEERILELSVPSHDVSLPLERRHQVLALARQGIGLEEIVKRLRAPAGEAELILNLGKYMNADNPQNAKINERVGQYA